MTSWGFLSNSLDLRRFLPLLHSQAAWNVILTAEKSSRAKVFPTQLQIEAGLEGVDPEGVLEGGESVCCALTSHAQGTRDTPGRERSAPQPLRTQVLPVNYLHVAALTQSRDGQIQTARQEKPRFSGS